MVMAGTESDTYTWRILLCASDGEELLAFNRPSGICLPTLSISRHERTAGALNEAARRQWQIETICVAPLDIAEFGENSDDARYEVMEVLHPEDLSRFAPRTRNIAALKATEFADVRDYLAARRVMKLDGTPPCDSHEPFSRLGSFERISRWVDTRLPPSCRRTGTFRQLHANGRFALIRFETTSGAVWFKATGAPNLRERAVSECLAALFPKFVPKVLSSRDDWNAWLTAEIDGVGLGHCDDLSVWCQAAASLAELQIASLGHEAQILRAAAHDARSEKLIAQVGPFFAQVDALMKVQIKTPPRKLHASEILNLATRVTDVLNCLASLAIPDSLNHFDLNPSNVLVGTDERKFLDWAEGAIGNPFYSFEYFRQHFLRVFGDNGEASKMFRESYTTAWRTVLPPAVIDEAMNLIPLAAIFAFAVSALPWVDALSNGAGGSAPFLRSLARSMQKEAECLERAAA
jgi:hypothetical protein